MSLQEGSRKKVKLDVELVTATTMEIDDGLYSRQRYVLVGDVFFFVFFQFSKWFGRLSCEQNNNTVCVVGWLRTCTRVQVQFVLADASNLSLGSNQLKAIRIDVTFL